MKTNLSAYPIQPAFALPPFSGRTRLNWRQPLHLGGRGQSQSVPVAHAHACPSFLTVLGVDETQLIARRVSSIGPLQLPGCVEEV